jgi:hypothetical protein
VPNFVRRRPLQRAVQVLKRHRDIYFLDDLDVSPPSILITTLAALAYTGENGILDAVINIGNNIEKLIENRSGVWWVANPVAPLENFADKWATHPERRTRFLDWLLQLRRDLADIQATTLPNVIKRMQPIFGEAEVLKAAEGLGKEYSGLREQGALTAGGVLTTLGVGLEQKVKDHTFYGGRIHSLEPTAQLVRLKNAKPGSDGTAKHGHLRWRGKFQPTSASAVYTVEIQHTVGHRPVIRVIDPPLEGRPGEALPHVFPGDLLCVYRGDQWTADKSLALILPWISEWLLYYELWLTTGKWYGGGHEVRTAKKDSGGTGRGTDGLLSRAQHAERIFRG